MIKYLDMETKPSQGLYPLHRCKTIHLVCFCCFSHYSDLVSVGTRILIEFLYFRWDMLKGFTMLKERRTIRLTYLRIYLMHILHLLDGNK